MAKQPTTWHPEFAPSYTPEEIVEEVSLESLPPSAEW